MQRWTLIILLAGALAGCAQPRPIGRPATAAAPFGRPAPSPTAALPAEEAPTAGAGPFVPQPTTEAPAAPGAEAPSPAPAAEAPSALPTEAPAPTEVPPSPVPTPSPTPEFIVVPATPSAGSSQERWRAQQLQREVIQPPRLYEARQQASLLWYDPTTGQVLEIGTVQGTFPAQAQFTFRQTNQPALEVPYRINGDFGLTSISDALQQRMRTAGYDTSVEAFVYLTDSIVPKP